MVWRSASLARSIATSGLSIETIALTVGLICSICSMCAIITSRAEISRSRIRRARALAELKTISSLDTICLSDHALVSAVA